MNFSDLTDEQKKYILIGVVGVALIGVVIGYGLKFSGNVIKTSTAELDDLTQKITSAQRAFSKQEKNNSDLMRIVKSLDLNLDDLPPDQNYYSWVTGLVTDEARLVGLEIDTIDKHGKKVIEGNLKDKTVKLTPFSVRIIARGGYNELIDFVRQIETKHPLVWVTSVDISTGRKPDVHEIKLIAQWPAKMRAMTASWKNVVDLEK